MLLFFFLLSFLVDVWASHPQAPGGGGGYVALLDKYYRMENLGTSLDENTKRALRLTVELGCRIYARHHSFKHYECAAIASRVHLSNFKRALQMFFPGCKVTNLEGNLQKHPSMTFNAPPYVVTTVKKYGTGFYTDIVSLRIWIRFEPSRPKTSAHLRAFLTRNSKYFDIQYLQDIHRDALAKILSMPNLIERVVANDISTSKAALRYVIAHTVENAFSVTTPEFYKEAIYKGLSSYFSELELHQYTFSPNISYVAMVPEFTAYKSDFPLVSYTNESKLLIKGCIPVEVDLYGPPMKMGMIVASFPAQVFVIYFKGVYKKTIEVMYVLLHHFADKFKSFDIKKHDRFLKLFEKRPID